MYKAAVESVAQAVADETDEAEKDCNGMPTPSTANLPQDPLSEAPNTTYPHALSVTPNPGEHEYDYSPTIPTASNQQIVMNQHNFAAHTPDGSSSTFIFPPHIDAVSHPQQHSGHAPFLNEEDAAEWLASQNQGSMPHMSMAGNGWDEWWWQGNGEGAPRPNWMG